MDEIRIKVNGEYQGYIKDGTHAIGYILSLGMEDLKYFSLDGILRWIEGALDTAEEMIEWNTDIQLKKRIIMYRKSIDKITDRDHAMNLYVNVALACEGLSTLSGFGMSNVESKQGRMKSKSRILTNPEKQTIY